MLSYELGILLHNLIPFIVVLLSLISGVIISNLFWKKRIHRYAKAEVQQILEYQRNKMEFLELENRELFSERKNLIAQIAIVKTHILKILETING